MLFYYYIALFEISLPRISYLSKYLSYFKNLEYLSLTDHRGGISPKLATDIMCLSDLKVLILRDNELNDEILSSILISISCLSNIEVLDISRIIYYIISYIFKLIDNTFKSHHYLTLSNTLRFLSNLTSLNLEKTNTSPEEIPLIICQLNKLRYLNIAYNKLCSLQFKTIISQFEYLTNLQHLEINSIFILLL